MVFKLAFVVKIVLLGDGAVGKTSLRNSFMTESFSHEYMMTVGADFTSKEVNISVNDVQYDISFQIWDLAGQQRFQDIRSMYYAGARGAVLIFDVTRRNTFENTINWVLELVKNKDSGFLIPLILVGNKIDLRNSLIFDITTKEGQILADMLPKYYCDNQFDIPYIETSAKNHQNTERVFTLLAEQIVRFAKNSSGEANDI